MHAWIKMKIHVYLLHDKIVSALNMVHEKVSSRIPVHLISRCTDIRFQNARCTLHVNVLLAAKY